MIDDIALFISTTRNIVKFMENLNLTPGQIAVILTEVRSHAINAERLRIKVLMEAETPLHLSATEMIKRMD